MILKLSQNLGLFYIQIRRNFKKVGWKLFLFLYINIVVIVNLNQNFIILISNIELNFYVQKSKKDQRATLH